jgi:hypothetical protein
VLLGFGRNSFGRFSVAGIYDQKTGELRCEKKYMVTKFTAKRGRRSYAECAATAAASGVPPHLLSATYFGAAAHPPQPLLPPSTRQRLAPSALQDDWGVEETGHKRKRGLSLGVAHRDRDSMSALSGSTGRASWGGKGGFCMRCQYVCTLCASCGNRQASISCELGWCAIAGRFYYCIARAVEMQMTVLMKRPNQ